MIPANDLTPDFETVTQPSYDWKLDLLQNRMKGFTDGQEAVKQAIYIILTTERYKYEIHSWNFGVELNDLIGQPIPYVYPEIERRVIDALTIDDRIESVNKFEFSHTGNSVFATFTVNTVFGEIDYKLTVEV